ncbi:DUF4238 domain-containing protein [Bradyrhizobium barranii subsp. apii]|uniref:DUF4238 domain-containing protein n=1 Tax=Bradyrhizobium barranii TaxID=2992140 RepID=UPI001AA0DCAB|nr:DUF4238 domain-containing protein [Bradyrhizobium barranii]UPT97745.1 DUF4238 domain-containing protein [Bradyrhizobium barranii subsp. apii]
MDDPRDHHVVPQFFLRNFAIDEARTKVTTLAKEGTVAVWMERSIKSIGYERDFYVHMQCNRPMSVETDINRTVETPISRSDTWAKIVAGRSADLDQTDRPILYSLVRHLEARTPHYLQTSAELAAMAADPSSEMEFTEEEREMYTTLRANPDLAKLMFNAMALRSFADDYDRSLIQVARSPIPLRSSTTPVLPAPAPAHAAMDLPLPGMVPFQRVLAVDPHTLILVVAGDFDGAFVNGEMPIELAHGFNRSVVGQFAHFPKVRHMICGRDRLIDDMTWAPFELASDTPAKMIFQRRSAQAEVSDGPKA